MNSTVFTGTMHATASEANALQARLRFVFTDYLPNANNQGIPKTEIDNIIRSGLHMPVKVNFKGNSVAGHGGAIPVGPIVSIEEDADKLIGNAVVWKDEFPDFVSYLEERSAKGEDVQFSWEIYYRSSASDNQGIDWLHGCSVAGITVVDNPAYKGRTPLLAIAEETQKMDEMQDKIKNLMNKLYSMLDALYTAAGVVEEFKVANPEELNVDSDFSDIIEKVKSMREQLASSASATTALASEKQTLEQELESLRAYKNEIEQTKARAELLVTRRAALAESGVVLTDEDYDAQADFLAGLEQSTFEAYVVSVARLVKPSAEKKAGAEIKKSSASITPDPLHTGRTHYTTSELAAEFKKVIRS